MFTLHVSLSPISLHKQTKFLFFGVGHYSSIIAGATVDVLLLCPVPTDENENGRSCMSGSFVSLSIAKHTHTAADERPAKELRNHK